MVQGKLSIVADNLKFNLTEALTEPIKGAECFQKNSATLNSMMSETIGPNAVGFKVTFNDHTDTPIIIVKDGIFFKGRKFKIITQYKFLPKCDIASTVMANKKITITPIHGQDNNNDKKIYTIKSPELELIHTKLEEFGLLGIQAKNNNSILPAKPANAANAANPEQAALEKHKNYYNYLFGKTGGKRRKTKRAKKNKRRTRRS